MWNQFIIFGVYGTCDTFEFNATFLIYTWFILKKGRKQEASQQLGEKPSVLAKYTA